jgi:hypothetical protein
MIRIAKKEITTEKEITVTAAVPGVEFSGIEAHSAERASSVAPSGAVAGDAA